MITQARLKEVLKYDPATGIFTWIKSIARAIKINSVAGCLNQKGYVVIGIDGFSYRANRLAWLYMYGYFPENDVDHENRIKTDNRKRNLREISKSCNIRNQGNQRNNKSGVKGVCWKTTRNKWESSIFVNHRRIYLGSFNDFTEAVCHRLAAEQAEGWSNCDSSSPAYQFMMTN